MYAQLLLAILFGATTALGQEQADFVLTGGRVHTLDAKGTVAEAVAIRAEKIVYVGSDEGAKARIGPKTEVYRAAGRTVIPGINETHVHAIGVAQGEAVEPFQQLGSIAEIQEWTRQAARKTAGDAWIRLPRVDITRIRERRMPTRAELDAAVPDRPVVYIWQYANRQVQVLNSAALKAAGIDRNSPQPERGRIVKDDAGEPTGVIEDAAGLTSKFLPRRSATKEQALGALEKVLQAYHRLGITSITERGSNVEGWKTYNELRAQGRLTARVTLTIRVGSDGTVEGTERFIRGLPFRFGDGDDWVKVGPLKIGVDGGVLYGTAWMREPYGEAALPLYFLSDPAHRGLLQMDAERVKNIIRTGHRLGWQMSSHVTGDAGVDIVLDAVEAAHADSPIDKRRYALIHAYFPSPETAARAARLGVAVDTQPAWFYKDGDALLDALGERRLVPFIGVATWQAAGVKVALNSDHMQGIDPDRSLNPYNPFLALYTAVTRKTESSRVIGPYERVSRLDALRMMTADAAWLHFDETRKGTLEVGKLGDLAVLDSDYFSCPEDQIQSLHSVLTVVGGKVVHRADEKAGQNSVEIEVGEAKAVFVKVSPRNYEIDYPDFYFQETEVTNRMFREFLRATGKTKDDTDFIKIVRDRAPKRNKDGALVLTFSTGDIPYSVRDEKMIWRDGEFPSGTEEHPVALVTLPEARAFCEWLSKTHSDKGLFRLPTWNEWMIAAYGSKRAYPWGDTWDSTVVHTSYGDRGRMLRTEPVKNRPRGNTPEGVYGMLGNVAEYIAERDATSGEYFNLGARWMGASFDSGVALFREAKHVIPPREDYWGYSHHAVMRADDVGFRVLLDPKCDRSLLSRGRVFKQRNDAWRDKRE
jgi:hypothetical protein